jgi:hypothetical protein
MVCATPLNTRIFAGDFQFGEFRAILRGVFVKKIHIFFRAVRQIRPNGILFNFEN